MDGSDLILEVTAGVGGQEAMLFTSEMFDMYQQYAAFKRWHFETLEYFPSELGQCRSEVSMAVIKIPWPKATWKKGFLLSFSLQCLKEKSGQELQAGTWRQEPEHRPQRKAAHCFLLLAASACFLRHPKTICPGVASPTSIQWPSHISHQSRHVSRTSDSVVWSSLSWSCSLDYSDQHSQ